MLFIASLIATAMASPMLSARGIGQSDLDPSKYPACSASAIGYGADFYLRSSDGTFVAAEADGQLYTGPAPGVTYCNTGDNGQTSPQAIFHFATGQLRDFAGRVAEISSAGQFQDNPYVTSTASGFGLCTNSLLTYQGTSTWYACKNDPQGNAYKLYTGTQVPQGTNDNCNAITLTAVPLTNSPSPTVNA
ncbi:hypothetical protein PYCC9005_003054 [Savitreella phatthalungensis]